MGLVGYYIMRVKQIVDPSKVDVQKLSRVIEKLVALGMFHDGEIICALEQDPQIIAIIDSITLKQYNI